MRDNEKEWEKGTKPSVGCGAGTCDRRQGGALDFSAVLGPFLLDQ